MKETGKMWDVQIRKTDKSPYEVINETLLTKEEADKLVEEIKNDYYLVERELGNPLESLEKGGQIQEFAFKEHTDIIRHNGDKQEKDFFKKILLWLIPCLHGGIT